MDVCGCECHLGVAAEVCACVVDEFVEGEGGVCFYGGESCGCAFDSVAKEFGS